eukprot:12888120-Prorocentrum_lima.AAC.1
MAQCVLCRRVEVSEDVVLKVRPQRMAAYMSEKLGGMHNGAAIIFAIHSIPLESMTLRGIWWLKLPPVS